MARTCVFPILRFASVDPGRDGWNLYAYVGGNPVKFVDPDGREGILASDEDRLALEGAGKKNSRVQRVLDAFGPGSGRTLSLQRGDPGTHANGLPLEGKTEVQFGRQPSSESMIQAYDEAGGGEAGTEAADRVYKAAANDVTTATVTLAPAAGSNVMLHELGHIEQALRDPEAFRQQAAEAAEADTSAEYRASASEQYAEEFRKAARKRDEQ